MCFRLLTVFIVLAPRFLTSRMPRYRFNPQAATSASAAAAAARASSNSRASQRTEAACRSRSRSPAAHVRSGQLRGRPPAPARRASVAALGAGAGASPVRASVAALGAGAGAAPAQVADASAFVAEHVGEVVQAYVRRRVQHASQPRSAAGAAGVRGRHGDPRKRGRPARAAVPAGAPMLPLPSLPVIDADGSGASVVEERSQFSRLRRRKAGPPRVGGRGTKKPRRVSEAFFPFRSSFVLP
jgi:hypothetical protein